jgi:hypothetical protein
MAVRRTAYRTTGRSNEMGWAVVVITAQRVLVLLPVLRDGGQRSAHYPLAGSFSEHYGSEVDVQ